MRETAIYRNNWAVHIMTERTADYGKRWGQDVTKKERDVEY